MSLFSGLGDSLFGVPQPSPAPYQQQAQQLQQGAGQYAGQEQSAYAGLGGLGGSLWNTINGGAPSAADLQLQQSFGQNLNQGLAMGAGAGGANSVLARYLAAQQTGSNANQLAQAAAIQRAREIQSAQQQLQGVYSTQGQLGSGLYGTNLSTGLGYAGLANSAGQANANRDLQTEAAGLQALSGAGQMFFARPPSGGGGGM